MGLRKHFNPNQLCPCDSGVLAGFCCLQAEGKWNKLPSSVWPEQPISNTANANCYARVTNDCSLDMSREHYISQTVLKSCGDGNIDIAGLHWLPAEQFTSLATSNLVSKILCRRHNNALTSLDSEAGRLIRTIGRYDKGFNDETPQEEIKVFSGEDIERWMLKTVCGMVGSGHVSIAGIVQSTVVQDVWVDILYGRAEWPEPCGMYIQLPGISYHYSSFSFQSKSHPHTGVVVIADLELNGIRFSLLLDSIDNPETLGIRRPRTIIFEQSGIRKYIELSWQSSENNSFVEFSRRGTYNGPSPDWPEWAKH